MYNFYIFYVLIYSYNKYFYITIKYLFYLLNIYNLNIFNDLFLIKIFYFNYL